MDVISALREHSEAGAAIVDLLYGEMGAEVSKAIVEFGKLEDKTKQRLGQTSNVVGLGAGLAATPGAIAAVRPAYRKAVGKPKLDTPSLGKRLKRIGQAHPNTFRGDMASAGRHTLKALKRPKVALGLAAGAAGLQVGNVAGDALVSQLLKDKPKKKPVRRPVAKSDTFEIYTEISKVDEDKRQVFGWASVTKHNGVDVLDLQDDMLPLEEIEKAAYDFVHKSRVGGNMHQKGEEGPIHVSDMIESFVVTPEKKAAMGLPDDFPEGWWVGYKVNDDKTWGEAKDGKLAGFSIHGSGRRVPVGA